MARNENAGAAASLVAPTAPKTEAPKAAANRYYVQHPIARGPLRACVKIVGLDERKKAMYIVGRKYVVDALPGSEDAVEKWIENRCLVLYNPAVHDDAIIPGASKPAAKESTSQSSPILAQDGVDSAKPAIPGEQSERIPLK